MLKFQVRKRKIVFNNKLAALMNRKKLRRIQKMMMIHQFQNKRNKKMVKIRVKKKINPMMKIHFNLNHKKKQKSDYLFCKNLITKFNYFFIY